MASSYRPCTGKHPSPQNDLWFKPEVRSDRSARELVGKGGICAFIMIARGSAQQSAFGRCAAHVPERHVLARIGLVSDLDVSEMGTWSFLRFDDLVLREPRRGPPAQSSQPSVLLTQGRERSGWKCGPSLKLTDI